MAADAPCVRDAQTPEPDVIAVGELMHVEAEAGAYVAEYGKLRRLRARKIFVGRELHVAGLALEGRNLEAGPFGERGIVGEILPPGRLRAAMGIEQGGKVEGLRRLHDAQSFAGDRPRDGA